MIHRYWSKKMLANVGRKNDQSRFKKEESPDDADRTFPNRHYPNIIQGLNRKYNSRHRSLWTRDWYFSAGIAQIFYKRWPVIFFYGRWCFFVGCCRKNLQCRSARFFRSSSTEVVFRLTPACFHLLGKESISPPQKKTRFTDTDRKKCYPTSARKDNRSMFKKEASPDDADRTFPNRHHPNIIQGLNRKYNRRRRSLWSRDWYFSAGIAQIFYKRWPVIFFYGRWCFFVGCCRKNLQCRSARFFRSSSTEVVFRLTPACFHLLGTESISPPQKKTRFTDTDRKKC